MDDDEFWLLIFVLGTTTNFVTNTFEDEPKIRSDAERKEWEKKLDSTFTGVADQNSDGDDDDEDLLACIHIGMQNNRYSFEFFLRTFYCIKNQMLQHYQ